MTTKDAITVRWEGTPVSANRRLAPGRGRLHASTAYLCFKMAMAARLLECGRKVGAAPVEVDLELTIPPQMDVDAIIKPCLDAIQESGIIDNDRQVKSVTARKVSTRKPYGVLFQIRPQDESRA